MNLSAQSLGDECGCAEVGQVTFLGVQTQIYRLVKPQLLR